MRALCLALGLVLSPAAALASICHSFVEGVPGIRYASLETAALSPAVRILYVAHSTYRIETPAGIASNTDYFGANGPGEIPTVVTMNHAHQTHYTDYPDPAIEHVLRGWNPAGDGPAEHFLELEDVIIRNVTTDIRGWGEPEKDGNSIFVFEVANLCIGDVGHLHHMPTEGQFAALGRMDVLMLPVDGGFTMRVEEMIELAKRLKSSVVLPMHYFGRTTLERFLAGMADEFQIEIRDETALDIAYDTLPSRPTVMVLPPVRSVGLD